jgi:hypothetical protein
VISENPVTIIIIIDRTAIKDPKKNLNYKDLTTGIQPMWNAKAKVIGLIRGNWNHLIIAQKISDQHTEKHGTKELQKTAILDTAHILREVLT